MFSGIAGSYDLLNHLLSMNQDKRWRRKACALAAGEGPVLDVCAGTGDMAFQWVEQGAAERVTAADFCHEMLVLGREKSRQRDLNGKVEFLAADTLRLPFPDDHFGVVSVAFGIRNVADLRGGIREMARVVRPGGRVLILEFTMPKNPIFRAVYLFYFLFVLPFVGNLVSGTQESAYNYLPRSVLHFPDQPRLLQMMEEEGLTEVRADNLSMGIVNVLSGRKVRRGEG
jgi:demethylmenaquinone methyltransferase/2-methoxy-6-polyprenyl-1,4-benzoquinol methylase